MICEWCFEKILDGEPVKLAGGNVFHEGRCYNEALNWIESNRGKSIDSLWETAT